MVITPSTDIYLLKSPLEISDINQLTFNNATAQYNYFNSLPKIGVNDYSYQRKDGTIRYGGNFDDIIGYNYVMYRNDAYSNKWFYAYITGMEYLNDNVTAVSIKTDVYQTWMFELEYKPVLIDREHVNDDTVGKHNLPEGLELGEMVCNGDVINFAGVGGQYMEQYCCVVEVSQVENTGESTSLSYQWVSGTHSTTPSLNSIFRGTIPLVLGFRSGNNSPSSVTRLYDMAGLGDAIVNVYMLPKSFITEYHEIDLTATGAGTPGGGSYTIQTCVVPASSSGTIDIATTDFTRPTSLDGYTPKNGKLKTYPFMYFNISNNAGTTLPYRYENFAGSVTFKTEATFGLSGSTKTIPQNYLRIANEQNGLDYSISGAKFPVCSWKSDSYTNWLTQNGVNMSVSWQRELIGAGVDILGGAGQGLIGGGAIGGAIGAGTGLFSGAVSLVNLAREQHLAKTAANMVADQSKGNLNAGDFIWAKYRSPFTYMPMSIKAEYARCVDEYFSQFGYKCNRVKRPNIFGRRNWNYVKTIGCYIAGDVPQDDLNEIKAMFDKGVTFWHNPNTFMDYSQNNDII
jgi:hypothetical protein